MTCFAGCNKKEDLTPITKDVEGLRLLKGVNLSALEDPYKPNRYLNKEATYTNIAEQGFDHIRLPVDFRCYCNEDGVLNNDFQERLDKIINMANHAGLAVMLDFHGWYDLNVENGDDALFITIWKYLAEHYKDYSNMLLFELINEPHTTEGGDLGMIRLMQLQSRTIEAIRAISPDRTIVVATAEWNGSWTLKDFEPLEYDNLILAVHTYAPMDFTHQGQAWAGRGDDKYPLTDDMLIDLYTDLNRIKEFKERTGMEVILNEFGASTNGVISDDDLYRYFSTITKFADKNDFGWTYWEYNSGFGVYDKGFLGIGGKWREVVLDALLLR